MRLRAGLLEPLRHRDFRLFATATLVSLLGDGLFRVAISLQVYAIEQDPRALGAVALAWALGQFLLLPIGGWASDRLPRRLVIVAADCWRAVLIGALGLLSLTDRLTLPQMVVLGAGFGIGNAFFNPASITFLPDLVPDERLPRANAFLGGTKPLMLYVVGPLLGGLVVGLAGPGTALVFDAASFLVSAALVLRITARSRPSLRAATLSAPWRAAVQGLRFVAANRWLWLGMLALAVSGLAYQGPFEVLLPFLLISDFGQSEGEAAATLAAVFAAWGVGSVATAAVVARWQLTGRFIRVYYGGESLALLALVGVGAMSALWQGVLAGLVIGAMFALTEIIWTTTLQRYVSRDLLGRVSSLDWMVSVGLAPLSFALAGVLGASFGARGVLVSAGLLGAGMLLGLAFVPGATEPERLADQAHASEVDDGAAIGALHGDNDAMTA